MKITFSILKINQKLAKLDDGNKILLLVIDGKVLYPSPTVDKDSYYPRNGTGYLFTTNKENNFIQQFNNITSTRFKDQASAILIKR